MLLAAMPLVLGLGACASMGEAGGGAATAIPAVLTAAVADAGRPEADSTRDADRKPAEVAAFAGVGPGKRIGEISPGGGYFTRIFSKAVGANGMVYALVGARPPNAPAPTGPTPMEAIAADPQYSNVRVVTMDPTKGTPEPVDIVWTSLSYHDQHNRPNADLMAFNKMAFMSLKKGGTFLVIDHAAADGSGKRDTNTLHRIDPALVRSEIEAAGFKFVSQSDVLRNPEDAKDKGIRDVPRGKTDQFVFKFRKP